MITRNLRHLRVFLAVAETGSVTRSARRCHVSQPAVTQAVAKLEREAGAGLFRRTPHGLFLTEQGELLVGRVRRVFALLDPALAALSPRLARTATAAQLQSLIALCEAENFTLAARRLGIAQPTVHRAVSQFEHEAGRPLFERSAYGIIASRPAQSLAQAARLAFVELDQADTDLAESLGREVGRIVVGALPLSRSRVLPQALARFRQLRPTLPVTILDGRYDDLLAGLRRGEIDIVIGALRDPAPIEDVEQVPLFGDSLVLLSRRDHPLLSASEITLDALARYPWVVPRPGTPARAQFDALFAPLGPGLPASVIDSGSVILMRELLRASDHLGCISRLQAEAEISKDLLAVLPFRLEVPDRPIGLTLRRGWVPTAAQSMFLDQILAACRRETAPSPDSPG